MATSMRAITRPAPVRRSVEVFEADPQMIFDVIQRQAGSLAKAILEGVMNSVDAKSTYCRIVLNDKTLLIEDDGQGMNSREHIEKFFKVFGKRHEASEQKIYGTFRMGRGQLFSFGMNRWKSGPFEMLVDIKKKGLKFDLDEYTVAKPGCRIEITLYNPLLPSERAETLRTLEQWAKYAPCRILLNNKEINVDPATEKWDHVTDDAYIRLKSTYSLAVYNLGVHTLELGSHALGSGGVVVSKKQLKVNFARNDIQSDCPVWKRLKQLVNKNVTEKNKKAPVLTDGARQRLADQVLRGEISWRDAEKLKLLTSVNGRHFSFGQALNRRYSNRISDCPSGDLTGDTIHQSLRAFVLADKTLDRFHVSSVPQLLAKLKVRAGEWWQYGYDEVKYVPFEKLSATLKDQKCFVLDVKQLSPVEKIWREAMESVKHWVKVEGEYCDRKFEIGRSDIAEGWTDGDTMIAINRKFLAKQKFDNMGFTNLGLLVIHEACHGEASTAEHDHTQEFYEAVHDTNNECLAKYVKALRTTIETKLNALGRAQQRAALRDADAQARIEQATPAGIH